MSCIFRWVIILFYEMYTLPMHSYVNIANIRRICTIESMEIIVRILYVK